MSTLQATGSYLNPVFLMLIGPAPGPASSCSRAYAAYDLRRRAPAVKIRKLLCGAEPRLYAALRLLPLWAKATANSRRVAFCKHDRRRDPPNRKTSRKFSRRLVRQSDTIKRAVAGFALCRSARIDLGRCLNLLPSENLPMLVGVAGFEPTTFCTPHILRELFLFIQFNSLYNILSSFMHGH
jgi:hypothetical protein